MNNDNPFFQCINALDNRKRIRAILLDYFPTEKVKANVLVIAYDSGIVSAIRDCEIIDAALINRLEKRLMTDYAIKNDMAHWSVHFWIEMYGVELLGKTMVVSADHKQTKDIPIIIPKKKAPYTNTSAIYGTFFNGKNEGYKLGYEQGFMAGHSTGRFIYPNPIPESPEPNNYAFSNGFNVGFREGFEEGYEEGCNCSGNKSELEKPISLPYNNSTNQQKTDNVTDNNKNDSDSRSDRRYYTKYNTAKSICINLEDLKDGDKLPKSVVNIDMNSFAVHGISKITCAVRKDYTDETVCSLKITGEYECKTSKMIILVFMCFNHQNELIGTCFDETIADNFKGYDTYSTNMDVPKWETIERIELRGILHLPLG